MWLTNTDSVTTQWAEFRRNICNLCFDLGEAVPLRVTALELIRLAEETAHLVLFRVLRGLFKVAIDTKLRTLCQLSGNCT